MIDISIKEKGFTINIDNIEIRTPCDIQTNSFNLNLILEQIRLKSIQNFSIKKNNGKVLMNSSYPFLLNYKQDNLDNRDFKIQQSNKLSESIQSNTHIDYSNQMSPVKNQGRLGSCVAFAVSSMKEWQEQQEHNKEVSLGKKDNRKKKYYDYSEQWIYYNCKKIDPWPNEEGTSLRYAMKVLNKIGVPCEKAWEYNDQIIGSPKSWAKMIALWALGGTYYRINGPEELIISLANNGPTAIGIICFQEIFNVGTNGIIRYPNRPNYQYGGHAICVTGYNPTTRLFKFKNSWGTSWGQYGYGYLPYRYIQNFMIDAWTIQDIQVTRDVLKERRSL